MKRLIATVTRSATSTATRSGSVDTDDVLAHIDRYGIEHSEQQLAGLARTALRLGVVPSIVSLLTDREAPAVARERAAARTVAAIRQRPFEAPSAWWTAA